jgi:predicted amidohydrolase YtcJ
MRHRQGRLSLTIGILGTLGILGGPLLSAGCRQDSAAPAAGPARETAAATPPLTMTVVNARVWTGDPGQPWAEAVGIAGDHIARVGSTAELRALPTARTIDAQGRLVLPGFSDAHVHFLQGGFNLTSVQLRDVKTRAEFVARLKAFAATVPPGTWIRGGDWDHQNWGGELPARQWIDEVTPQHPVWINRLDGHMNLANSLALKLSGVTRDVKDIPGGTIVRNASGELTGLLKDNAMSLVDRHVPPAPPDQEDRALDAAMRYVAEQGVTSVHHMGDWHELEVFERARKAGRLRTRIYDAVPLRTWERLRDTVATKQFGGPDGLGDDWLKIGTLKGFVDGSLGSHTAAFEQPFTDTPKDRGFFVNTPENLYAWISGADKAGLHVAVHAIGDRANHTLLDIYERVAREDGVRDRRFRIEHAQHLLPADIPRFAALGVIPSMQPYHAIDDGRWADKVIGAERAKTTYAFRALLDAKARLAFGSDWFVAPAVPLAGIYAAVTRRTLDEAHPDGWVPSQKITVEEAVRAYTAGTAYAEFAETRKGRLSPNYLADIVMLDRNIFEIPPPQIRETQVLLTVAGGQILFQR